MKTTLQYISMMLCTVLMASCNLFIDEELEMQLAEYSGKGYDERVTETSDDFSVTYQLKKSTMELKADNALTKYITRVETIDTAGCHFIYFDANTPADLLPRVGQHIVSSNIDIFPFGLCALVGLVEREGAGYVVTCKDSDVKDAFEYLQFHASMPAGDYLDEYDIYDEEGNFMAHIDNRQKHAEARAATRAEEGDDYLPLDLSIGIPSMDFEQKDAWHDKFLPKNMTLDFTGDITGKLYADCDFDWDKGLNISFKLKEGAITLKIAVALGTGMSSPKKLLGNDDLLNGKVRLTVGPVVVVPVFGFSVNYQIYGSLEAAITYTKPLDFEIGFQNGDFKAEDLSKPSHTDIAFEAACNVDFPIVKLSLGFGLFSSDLSIRAEVYATLATKVGVSMNLRSFGEDSEEPTNCDFNPKLTMDLKLGIAVSLVAKGMIISKVLNKIKDHVKERSSFMNAMDNYVSNGSYADWVAMKSGDVSGVKPEVLAEMEKLLGNKTGDDRAALIDSWVKSKAKELKGINGLSDKAVNTEATGHVVEPGEGEQDKEFVLRLGPFYPAILQWNLLDKYMFPKMKEGSFKVGQKWTAPTDPIVFLAEWTVEDPGILTNFRTLYPCFTVMSGSEHIVTLFPEELNAELNGGTPKGRIYRVEIPSLIEDEIYTCIPGYANEYEGTPVVQDKGLSFATFTPTIAIVKLVETGQEEFYQNVWAQTAGVKSHRFHFDTYTNVSGTMNVREWGILDNNNKGAGKTNTSKNATQLSNGDYTHHWTAEIHQGKTKVKISLSPYIFGRDATDLGDMSQAKVFPAFKKTLKSEWDFTDDSRKLNVAGTANEDGDEGTDQDYILRLDSVTHNGVRIM